MRKLILALIIAALLLTSNCNRILQITIVLPPTLIPYYEWFIDFPGWQPSLDEQNPIEIRTEYGDNQLSPIIRTNS